MANANLRPLPPRRGADPSAAYLTYLLADALARFRFYAETNYLSVPNDKVGPAKGGVPEIVDLCAGEIRRAEVLVQDVLAPAEAEAVGAVAGEVERLRNVLRQKWGSADHHRRLTALRNRPDAACYRAEFRLIRSSPLASRAWHALDKASNQLVGCLSPPLSDLFSLSRLLASVAWPSYAEWDAAGGGMRVYDTDYILGVVAPQVARHLAAIRAASDLLAGVPDPFSVSRVDDVVKRSNRLHKSAMCRLQDMAELSTDARPKQHRVLPAAEMCESPGAVSDVANQISPVSRDEYDRLRKLKDEIDPGGKYVGRSLPILRVFEAVSQFNRRPDEPVVLSGPSRSGKTALAHLIHLSSNRKSGAFIELSASSLKGGDLGVMRTKWVGFGKDSALGGTSAKQATKGYLQTAVGGTIFIDELQDLDKTSQEFLRQVLDRTPIPLAAGVGDPVMPNVRLVFATNRPIGDLDREGKLRVDVVNRLNHRVIEIPSLDDRKDDIPLFVERHAAGHPVCREFLLCLLRHRWERGQVGALVHAIEEAAATVGPKKKLTAECLRRMPELQSVVDEVARLKPGDAECHVLTLLVSALERQGYSGPRSGLQARLAEIMGVKPSHMSKLLAKYGLRWRSRFPAEPDRAANGKHEDRHVEGG